MKRIVLIGAALAGFMSAGITAAVASAATKTKTVTVTVTKVKRETKTVTASPSCKLSLTTAVPSGSTAVTPGTLDGDQYGSTYCSAGLRAGITRDVFSTDNAGDITGKIQHWFDGGTVYGTFTLTQGANNGPPTATSFGSSSYSGTVKVTGGGGLLKGATGTGTLKCTTPDATHYTCTEKLKLTQTVTELVPVKVQVREKVNVG